MGVIYWLVQGAAEYGAIAGEAGTGAPSGGSTATALVDQGFAFVEDNPVALLVLGLSLVVVIGLFRTRRYRS